MEDRFERVKVNVLNEIADDFEEIGQVMIQLDRWASDIAITRDEAKAALLKLVEDGLAKAYDLHVSQVPISGSPNPEYHFFYITPQGLESTCRRRARSLVESMRGCLAAATVTVD
ncbi:MAG: hypothetical protein ABIR70_03375 [Bryobacteraceae bacterium]